VVHLSSIYPRHKSSTTSESLAACINYGICNQAEESLMADNMTVHIAENSPEHVAYKLFEQIRLAEEKGARNSDREYILQTYARCLHIVRTAYYERP
jgi:hypothetical protein